MSRGKFERHVVVPAGGWGFSLTESLGGGATAIAFAEGWDAYWSTIGAVTLSTLAELIKTTLEADSANGLTYTVTLAAGEGGAGTLAISASAGTFTITSFTQNAVANNAMRDLLGFSADLSPTAATHTGDQQVQALWRPDGAYDNTFGPGDYGHLEADTRSSESAGGDVSIVGGGRTKRVGGISYRGLSRNRTRLAAEIVTGESLERFYQNDLLGARAYCEQPGGPVRWHPDADDDAEYGELKFVELRTHKPAAVKESWVGRWNHAFGRHVVQE